MSFLDEFGIAKSEQGQHEIQLISWAIVDVFSASKRALEIAERFLPGRCILLSRLLLIAK